MKKNDDNKDLFNKLEKIAEKNENLAEAIPVLLKLREYAKSIEDPQATKILRLTAQFIEKYDHFDIAEHLQDEDEGVPEDMTAFQYLLELLSDSDNIYNKEEITGYKNILLQA